MIFPEQYKTVGVSHFIPEEDADKRIYFLTEYMIIENNSENDTSYSLYHVKHKGNELLRDAESLELLSSGEEIVKYDKLLNIKDRALLTEMAHDICKNNDNNVNTVIFTGIDKHVTFVHQPDISSIVEIEIVDVIPPEPSWLVSVVRRLEASGIFGDLTVKFTENLTDLKQFEGDNTIFPCSASGLKGKCLDSDVITEDGHHLVGCEISKNLFESRFPGIEYSFTNICPFKSDVFKPSKAFITRCCRSEKSGIVKINDIKGAVVHWGASEFDVANAIWKLAGEIRDQETTEDKS